MRFNEFSLTEGAEDYAGTYSPEAIALGKRFCEHYGITDDTDVQLAVEIIDNYLEEFKRKGQPVDLKIIKSGVADAFRQVYRGMGPGPSFRKKFAEDSDEKEQAIRENLRKWFKEKWVRFNPQGKIMGPCARGSDTEGKPKCLPQSKAHSLGKKGRAAAAAKKRREDPNPERRGAAKNVATKVREGVEIIDQDYDLDQQVFTLIVDGKRVSFTYWDYENNFNDPDIKDVYAQVQERLGSLSPEQQKSVAKVVYQALKQGVAEAFGLYGPFTATINTGTRPKSTTKTKKFRREDDAILWAEDWLENAPQYVFATAEVTDPDGNVVWTTDERIDEKKDACYNKVRSRYKVWPSAYASGALVQCRKKGAANWGNKGKK